MARKLNFLPPLWVSSKIPIASCTAITMNPISHLQAAIAPLRQTLLHHPVYGQIQTLAELNIFMEHHVFVVWDYLSLLKALQRELTCVEVPWVPRGSPELRRLINELVLGMESDTDQAGGNASHYELYLDAMEASCADTNAIKDLVREISFGKTVHQALAELSVADALKDFVGFTFDTIAGNRMHEIAALFTFGRENLIPESFCYRLSELGKNFPGQVDALLYYLNRPIRVNTGDYSSRGLQMMVEFCGEDEGKWEECRVAAILTLEHRLALWEAIGALLGQRRQELSPQPYAGKNQFTDC